MIKDNIRNIQADIETTALKCGRDPAGIKLIVVTKEAAPEDIEQAVLGGALDLGENRVKDALAKSRDVKDSVCWHLIGHLQTNKARDAVRLFSLIHSVDSERLASCLDKEAARIGKTQDILIEVNVSGEASKFGVSPDGVKGLVEFSKGLKNISVLGLMTVAPLSQDSEAARPVFRRLKEIAMENGLGQLSMGMSQDYRVAIQEGATMVRIGSAIFKAKS